MKNLKLEPINKSQLINDVKAPVHVYFKTEFA